MAQEIYEFPNKSNLENNDLFLISDESTANHQIKNSNSIQTKNSIFKRDINSYVPIFSNVINTTVSDIDSRYVSLINSSGNWAQVTMNIALLPIDPFSSLSATIPFGGIFIDENDAICVGWALFVPGAGGTAGSFISKISAIPSTNNVDIKMYTNTFILNRPVSCAISFIYLIR